MDGIKIDPLYVDILPIMGGLQTSVQNLTKQVDNLTYEVNKLNISNAGLGDHAAVHDSIQRDLAALKVSCDKFELEHPQKIKDSEYVANISAKIRAGAVAIVILNAIIVALAWLYSQEIIHIAN